ncbi:Phage tail sheath protein [Candidatus Burkholderia pumila]|uniref:Phage tail sheath protein n=1 Tax=Candidatus Burkholderia pumila TaxID=1090375 RepID=A0ABR5HM08_9BURK|nr:Phage tail sheath protein [Candidatus Burkholderia pumila]
MNAPVLVGSPGDVSRSLGDPVTRKYNLATAMGVFFLEGVTVIQYVRVIDGTDTAAIGRLMDTATTLAIGATLTALYTGTRGNTITAAVSASTKASTYRVVVNMPGQQAEVFDNIADAGVVLWQNIVSAINNGNSPSPRSSSLVIAMTGVGTAASNVVSSTAFTSGTDGTATSRMRTSLAWTATPACAKACTACTARAHRRAT